MVDYLTVPAPASAELTVKKSRFLGQIAPVQSAGEAAAFTQSVKALHREAAHNVCAYTLRDGLRRYSDDGEPQGTAGLPVMGVLEKRGLTDCAVVVTRWFGGILLGAAGLARAYSQAAGAAADAAGTAAMTLCNIIRVHCGYAYYNRVQMLVSAGGAVILDTRFAGEVTLTLRGRADAAQGILAGIADASNGGAACEVTGEAFAVFLVLLRKNFT